MLPPNTVGVTADTIRYYQRAGLLPPPSRTPSGYRAYDAAAVDRLRFIQGAQRLGLRLSDIRDLLAVLTPARVLASRPRTCSPRRLAEVDAEIARLTALPGEMARMLAGLAQPECPAPIPGTWVPVEWGEVSAMDPVEVIDTCCDDCPPKAYSSGCC